MKTSYKIITATVVILFTGLLANNISLKAKYQNGNFESQQTEKSDLFSENGLEKKKLPDFKHLVINGAIVTKNGRKVNFNPNFSIYSEGSYQNVLGLRDYLAPLVRQHLSHDTLYISFQKEQLNEDHLTNIHPRQFVIQANALTSISVKNLNCSVESMSTAPAFSLSADSSQVTMNYIKTELLNLNIGKQSNVTYNGTGVVFYSVPSVINHLGDSYPLKKFSYRIDQGSTILINNKALVGSIVCLNPSRYLTETSSKSISIVSPWVK